MCRRGFHNSLMAYMLQIVKSTMHRIFVAFVLFMQAILSQLNLKLETDFYPATLLKFLFKLDMASQALPLTELNLS